MKFNVEALGTLYEMAHEGAQLAANRLARMTDIPTHVTVTRVDFADRASMETFIDDRGANVAVQVDLEGDIQGTSMIVFDRESALAIADSLIEMVQDESSDALRASTLLEVGQIMNSSFVNGWANVLDTQIRVGSPRITLDTDPTSSLSTPTFSSPSGTELALVFHSEMSVVGTGLSCQHYLFPSDETFSMLLDKHEGIDRQGIDYTDLVKFDRLADRGAETIAENLTKLTGIDTTVDIRRVNFLSLDAIPAIIPNEEVIRVGFSFTEMMEGYLLFLFDRDSARTLAGVIEDDIDPDDMVPLEGDRDDERAVAGTFSPMERDAIKEFSNIMASGLLDGWANVFDATIDHSTPMYAHDLGASVVDPLVVELGSSQEFAFVFDTGITAVDTTLDIATYVIPDEDDLEQALDALDAEGVVDDHVTADVAVYGMDTDPVDGVYMDTDPVDGV